MTNCRSCVSKNPGLTLLSVTVIFAVTLALGGCEPGVMDPGRVSTPIINGSVETGWPAVGALVLSYPFYGYTGSFCSATLIDKRWVLTAAHCATPSDEFPIAPGTVSFMITSDARPKADGTRPEGTLVQVDYFVPHDKYDGRNNDYDIALMHLSRDVTEVAPLPVNTSGISSLDGRQVFFTGFGVDNGAAETGGGLKRSANIPVASVAMRTFLTDAYNTAVCFGDSGGPGLYQMSGVWKVVGVNSAVSGYGSDPCIGIGIHVRADAHSTWISTIMNSYPPNCKTNSSACLCPEACAQDGTCDEGACYVKDCSEIVDCVFDCYSASNPYSCGDECYIDGDDLAREGFDNAMGCFGAVCYPAGIDWTRCMAGDCQEYYNACYLANREKLDCGGVFDCYADCLDSLCMSGCEWLALDTAVSDWNTMKSCMELNCEGETGFKLNSCLSEKCPDATTGCLKPDECDPVGGDCPDGMKCRQFMEHTTTCVESQGLGLGDKCQIEIGQPDPCGDGLMCILAEGGRLCRQVCEKAEGCDVDGEVCKGQPFPSLVEWGWCGCVDADEDSYCVDEDCDDGNSSVFPGSREWCDGIDNNCDGETDEGCTTACDDADGDGSCDEVDCDDERADVYPGAVELCNDNVDNNCNGSTDEDCATCVDLDKDGYCADRDCNDRDYRISPKAQEVCGDGIDNNCDGSTDEDCPGTAEDIIGADNVTSDDIGTYPGSSGGCSSTGSGPGGAHGLVFLIAAAMLLAGFRRRFNR